jgi:hypothetical protein
MEGDKMTKMKSVIAVLAVVGSLVSAAQSKKAEIVAEGYPAWNGVTARNYYSGRMISPSDLRHRAVVVVELDPSDPELMQKLPALHSLTTQDPLGSSHGIIWENYVMPRNIIILVSFRGKRSDAAEENIKKALAGKELGEDKRRALTALKSRSVAMYFNVELADSPLNPEGKYPFVYVMGPAGKDPLWSGVFSAENPPKEAAAAVRKAKSASTAQGWKLMTGVQEVKYFPEVLKVIAARKPVESVYSKLKQAIKGKDAEKAKEAQIVFDALEQYRSDLMLRVRLELHSAPARAYMDAQTLFEYYPKEKKNLADIQAQMKKVKEIGQIGKIFTSFMVWSDPEYKAKKSDYRKNIQEIAKWKKILAKLEQHRNAALSGEAALINSQLDMLIDTLNAKIETEGK